MLKMTSSNVLFCSQPKTPRRPHITTEYEGSKKTQMNIYTLKSSEMWQVTTERQQLLASISIHHLSHINLLQSHWSDPDPALAHAADFNSPFVLLPLTRQRVQVCQQSSCETQTHWINWASSDTSAIKPGAADCVLNSLTLQDHQGKTARPQSVCESDSDRLLLMVKSNRDGWI